MHLLLQEIRAAYTNAANPANAAPMAAYVKNVSPFFGIRSAGRKVMENAIFKATHHLDFDEVVQIAETLRAAPERELHYLAMDWLYHRRKKWTAQTISVIELLLTTKPWWDTVDFLASHCLGEWSLRFPEEGLKVIARYADSGNLWLERSAIIPQLFYREKTDTALLSGCISAAPAQQRILSSESHRLGPAAICADRRGMGADVCNR